MEIRHLNTFLQVAAIKNFTQAAKNLGYCQSSVSTQIQQLEKEVGVPLFNRVGRSISLTQYGEELLPYAQQIVSTAICMETLSKTKEQMSGTIRIGIVESLFNTLFEPVTINFHKSFPNVKIDLTVDSTVSLKEKLQEGTLDFACLIDDFLIQSEWRCWHTEISSIVIIANPSNELCTKRNVLLNDLENREFVLMEETAPYSRHFRHIMAEMNINFKSFLKLQSTAMACRLVEKSDFIAVLPYYSVFEAANAGRVHVLNVEDFSQSQCIQIVMHPNKLITPQVEGFLEELKKVIPNFIQNKQNLISKSD